MLKAYIWIIRAMQSNVINDDEPYIFSSMGFLRW